MNHRFIIATLACASLSLGCERGGSGDPTTPTVTRGEHGGAADEDKLETVKVTDGIHMLVGRGGNIGVSVGPDGILIIDDKFAPLSDTIRAALGELDKGSLRYVLNTHHHGDHTGGNEIFGREATIVAHDNVRKWMKEDGKPAVALPVITFESDLSVHFNGERIRAVHFANGHTDGDSVIFFENAKVVHMGDHFFNKRFPYVDIDHGGNPVQLAENVRTVLGRIGPDTKIIPGHGDLASRADLATYLEMLDESIALVREQVAAKKSLDAIKKRGVPARWSTWGKGFISDDKWLETLHRALTAAP